MKSKRNSKHFAGFEQEEKHNNGQMRKQGNILADRVDNIMKDKFMVLKDLYLTNAYENGYNSTLAFRVIGLYLYCDFKPADDEVLNFKLVDEVNRFINAELSHNQLLGIQKCMNLLMIKQLNLRAPQKYMKFWRIKVLASLKKYYAVSHCKKEKKKASTVMRELCKEQLKQENVKHDQELYSQVMDILLGEEKIIMNSKKAHGKSFEAIENGNNIVRILEKGEQVIIPKYQEQLMLAYWEIAKLHYQLHYVTYAKKYAETALNIAERINDKKIVNMARQMIDNLAT